VEIILGQARRRWSEDEKRALVAETFVDGQTVNGVARRHDISRSMLFGWRKQYCETGFAAPASTPIGFTPVAIARSEPGEPPIPPSAGGHAADRAGVWARRSPAYFRRR
jgi:transposase-like protein